jgi:hypothetical protein
MGTKENWARAGMPHDHELPAGESWARKGGCKHAKMLRAKFEKRQVVRCAVPGCGAALGRKCPECTHVY